MAFQNFQKKYNPTKLSMFGMFVSFTSLSKYSKYAVFTKEIESTTVAPTYYKQ